MKPAHEYPISFPYGATAPPYGTALLPYHRGNDRACPTGTPVLINGQQIGLTGSTGLSSGPHLHIQEWRGGYTSDRRPLNEFKGGTVIDTGWHSQFGYFVTIQCADGWNDTYAHLNSTNVIKGQQIGVTMTTDLAAARIFAFHIGGRNGYDGRQNALAGQSDADLNANHVGRPLDVDLNIWYTSPEGRNFREKILPQVYAERDALRAENKKLKEQLATVYEPVNETLYRKKG